MPLPPARRAWVTACVKKAAASQWEAAEPSTRPSSGASRVDAPDAATDALHSLVKISSRTLGLAQARWHSAMAATSSLADSVAVSRATNGSTAPAGMQPARSAGLWDLLQGMDSAAPCLVE